MPWWLRVWWQGPLAWMIRTSRSLSVAFRLPDLRIVLAATLLER